MFHFDENEEKWKIKDTILFFKNVGENIKLKTSNENHLDFLQKKKIKLSCRKYFKIFKIRYEKSIKLTTFINF